MSYFDENMHRDIIMDHISNPRNRDKVHAGYKEYTLKNPSCGDKITVYVKLENDLIKDVTYNVEGCSICISSASIMSDLLIGKTIEETDKIIENFNNMVTGNAYNEDLLQEAVSLKGVYKVPPRIKCATLGYKALLNAIGRDIDE